MALFYQSPLEQFEPIPFFVFYLFDINFSITNVTVISILVVFLLNFYFYGYVLSPLMLFYLVNFKSFFTEKTSSQTMSEYESFLASTGLNSMGNNSLPLSISDQSANTVHGSSVIGRSYEWLCLNYFVDQMRFKASLDSQKLQLLNHPSYSGSSSNLIKSEGSITSGAFSSNSSFYKNLVNKLNSKPIEFDNNDNSSFLKNFSLSCKKLSTELSLNNPQTSNNSNSQGVFFSPFLPNLHRYIFEFLYLTILNSIVKDSIDVKAKDSIKFFPIIFTVFLFIMVCNLIGLVPYSSTLTSYFIVTISLTLMVLFGTTMILVQKHGLKLFGLFLPGGTPLALLPLMIPLEIMSYFIRLISLSVRLFANMMAGHILLAVIAGFAWTMAVSPMLFLNYLQVLPLMVVYVLVGLETGVALIQAYVFTLLSAIYINDALNIDH